MTEGAAHGFGAPSGTRTRDTLIKRQERRRPGQSMKRRRVDLAHLVGSLLGGDMRINPHRYL